MDDPLGLGETVMGSEADAAPDNLVIIGLRPDLIKKDDVVDELEIEPFGAGGHDDHHNALIVACEFLVIKLFTEAPAFGGGNAAVDAVDLKMRESLMELDDEAISGFFAADVEDGAPAMEEGNTLIEEEVDLGAGHIEEEGCGLDIVIVEVGLGLIGRLIEFTFAMETGILAGGACLAEVLLPVGESSVAAGESLLVIDDGGKVLLGSCLMVHDIAEIGRESVAIADIHLFASALGLVKRRLVEFNEDLIHLGGAQIASSSDSLIWVIAAIAIALAKSGVGHDVDATDHVIEIIDLINDGGGGEEEHAMSKEEGGVEEALAAVFDEHGAGRWCGGREVGGASGEAGGAGGL